MPVANSAQGPALSFRFISLALRCCLPLFLSPALREGATKSSHNYDASPQGPSRSFSIFENFLHFSLTWSFLRKSVTAGRPTESIFDLSSLKTRSALPSASFVCRTNGLAEFGQLERLKITQQVSSEPMFRKIKDQVYQIQTVQKIKDQLPP